MVAARTRQLHFLLTLDIIRGLLLGKALEVNGLYRQSIQVLIGTCKCDQVMLTYKALRLLQTLDEAEVPNVIGDDGDQSEEDHVVDHLLK